MIPAWKWMARPAGRFFGPGNHCAIVADAGTTPVDSRNSLARAWDARAQS
jgi:hypothetical protein